MGCAVSGLVDDKDVILLGDEVLGHSILVDEVHHVFAIMIHSVTNQEQPVLESVVRQQLLSVILGNVSVQPHRVCECEGKERERKKRGICM